MFTLALQRRFTAQHHLIGGDWGVENLPHSHAYLLELRLEGDRLDKHGYLVDLVDVEKNLDELLASYADRDLNQLTEFSGLNPSLEHFAHILCTALTSKMKQVGLRAIDLRLWENDTAWASFRQDL